MALFGGMAGCFRYSVEDGDLESAADRFQTESGIRNLLTIFVTGSESLDISFGVPGRHRIGALQAAGGKLMGELRIVADIDDILPADAIARGAGMAGEIKVGDHHIREQVVEPFHFQDIFEAAEFLQAVAHQQALGNPSLAEMGIETVVISPDIEDVGRELLFEAKDEVHHQYGSVHVLHFMHHL